MGLIWRGAQVQEQIVQGLINAVDEFDHRAANEARKELTPGHGARTRTLSRSITVQMARREGNRIVGAYGTNLRYGLYLHQGTGLYGPKHAVIRPVHGRYLAWQAPNLVMVGGKQRKRGMNWIFARQVRGVKPNPYLRTGFERALPQWPAIARRNVQRMAK